MLVTTDPVVAKTFAITTWGVKAQLEKEAAAAKTAGSDPMKMATDVRSQQRAAPTARLPQDHLLSRRRAKTDGCSCAHSWSNKPRCWWRASGSRLSTRPLRCCPRWRWCGPTLQFGTPAAVATR